MTAEEILDVFEKIVGGHNTKENIVISIVIHPGESFAQAVEKHVTRKSKYKRIRSLTYK